MLPELTETESMSFNALLDVALRLDGKVLANVPPSAIESTVAATVLLVSTSVTVMLPLVVNPASVSVSPAVSAPLVITGTSLLPVIVTVTVSVSFAGVPLLSTAFTV
jgi:hypothetical protein